MASPDVFGLPRFATSLISITQLTRDECGDWLIPGRRGNIYRNGDGYLIVVHAGSARGWTAPVLAKVTCLCQSCPECQHLPQLLTVTVAAVSNSPMNPLVSQRMTARFIGRTPMGDRLAHSCREPHAPRHENPRIPALLRSEGLSTNRPSWQSR